LQFINNDLSENVLINLFVDRSFARINEKIPLTITINNLAKETIIITKVEFLNGEIASDSDVIENKEIKPGSNANYEIYLENINLPTNNLTVFFIFSNKDGTINRIKSASVDIEIKPAIDLRGWPESVLPFALGVIGTIGGQVIINHVKTKSEEKQRSLIAPNQFKPFLNEIENHFRNRTIFPIDFWYKLLFENNTIYYVDKWLIKYRNYKGIVEDTINILNLCYLHNGYINNRTYTTTNALNNSNDAKALLTRIEQIFN